MTCIFVLISHIYVNSCQVAFLEPDITQGNCYIQTNKVWRKISLPCDEVAALLNANAED